jgi:hypothetical protein
MQAIGQIAMQSNLQRKTIINNNNKKVKANNKAGFNNVCCPRHHSH